MAKTSPISEIAEAFGVAESTVYRAISGDGKGAYKKSAERSEKIREMARQLGFRINASARATRRGWTGCIGMLVSPRAGVSVMHTPDLDHGVIRQLAEGGQFLTKGFLPDDPTDEFGLPELLDAWAADGLLINYNFVIPERLIRLVDRHDVPTVWINTKLDVDCVYPDDYNAGKKAAKYLVERGHRRILIADASTWTTPEPHYSQIDRLAGCRAVMADAGLTPMVFGRQDSRRIMARQKGRIDQAQFAQRILQQRGDATAVLAIGPCRVMTLIVAAQAIGLHIPDDLSLLGFEDVMQGDEPADWEVHSTRLVVPFQQVGREAVKMVNRRIKNGNKSYPAKTVRYDVRDGRTVAVLPGE